MEGREEKKQLLVELKYVGLYKSPFQICVLGLNTPYLVKKKQNVGFHVGLKIIIFH